MAITTVTILPLQPNLMPVQTCLVRHTWMSMVAQMLMEMGTLMMAMHSIMTPTNGPTMMAMVIHPTSMTHDSQIHTAV